MGMMLCECIPGQGFVRLAQQWIHGARAGDMSHQREAHLLASVEHGPFSPGFISGISKPGAQIGIPHDQR